MSFYVYETITEQEGEIEMTEKVKLTREQDKRLKDMLNDVMYSKHSILEQQAKGWKDNCNVCLNALTLGQLATVLYEPNSYEVEPEYKYGDWVTKHYSDLSYLIGRVNQVRSDGMVGVNCSGGNIVFIPYEELSASTPEEIKAEKERRVWAKIDREVGEFKHNDNLMTDDGPILVIRPSSVVPYRGGMITVDELYAKGKIEGIYPVESFVSFEDGQ